MTLSTTAQIKAPTASTTKRPAFRVGPGLLAAALLLSCSAQAVAQQSPPSGEVLYLTASWCTHCKAVSPIVSRLSRAGLPIRTMDVDRNQSLVRQTGVATIPAFLVIVDGRVRQKIEGKLSESQIRNLIAKLPKPAPVPEPEVILTRGSSEDARGPRIVEAPVPGPAPAPGGLGQPAPFEMPKRSAPAPRAEAPLGYASADDSEAATLTETASHDNTLETPDAMPTTALLTSSQPFEASVRIKVKDKTGVSLGSGTVIFSRVGKAYILTCAHIFRDMNANSEIQVDLFDGQKTMTWSGTLLASDPEADTGLLAIEPREALPTALIAEPGTLIRGGDPVNCVGCSAGDKPTTMSLKVTALNRYKGPDNIECTGLPVQGRSGGGLFNANRQVIGICIAADKVDRRGLYAGLKAVHELLTEAKLDYLFRAADPIDEPDVMLVDSAAPSASGTPAAPVFDAAFGSSQEFGSAQEFGTTNEFASAGVTAPAPAAAPTGVPTPTSDTEVVCIIRSKSNPNAAPEVVVLPTPDAEFVSYLRSQMSGNPTSAPVETQTPVRTVSADGLPQPFERHALKDR